MYAGAGRREGAGRTSSSSDPLHPYTWGLLGSLPRLETDIDRLVQIPGHAAVAPVAAARLPLQPALPVRLRPLQAGAAGARAVARAPDAPAGVLPRRRDEAARGRADAAPRSRARRRCSRWPTSSLKVENLTKHFPVTRGIVFQKQVGGREGRRRRVASRSAGARRSASSASPAAASRRWRAASCGCSTRPSGTITFEGRDITTLSRTDMRPIRREMMMIFQDPVRVAEPAQARRLHRRRGARRPQVGHRRGDQAPRAGAARGRRPQPRALQPLPARVLGRPAPAHRHRPRARREPEADRLRRARLGARRLGAGPDPQPAQGPAGRVRPHLHLHRPRPQRRALHLRPRDGDVPRQGRRDRRRRTTSTRSRSIRTPARCSRPCRSRIRGSAARASRSCSRATCRTRSTRPTAAGSTRAAPASRRASATSTIPRAHRRRRRATRRRASSRSSAGR